MPYFPRQNKISVCTACGARTMCLSDDGGIVWNCNRCMVAYGVHRTRLDENPEVQKNPVIAGHPVYGDNSEKSELKEQPKVEQPKPEMKPEVGNVDKPRKARKSKKEA